MAHIKVENLKQLRESLCVAQGAIGQAYSVGESHSLQSEYAMSHIRTIQEVLDQIDILRPLGPGGTHGSQHTDFCGCDPNPLLVLKRTWRKVSGYEGYEVSGAGHLREGYYEGEPEPYEYTPNIAADGTAWYTLWVGGRKHLLSRTMLLNIAFPELKKEN